MMIKQIKYLLKIITNTYRMIYNDNIIYTYSHIHIVVVDILYLGPSNIYFPWILEYILDFCSGHL